LGEVEVEVEDEGEDEGDTSVISKSLVKFSNRITAA